MASLMRKWKTRRCSRVTIADGLNCHGKLWFLSAALDRLLLSINVRYGSIAAPELYRRH